MALIDDALLEAFRGAPAQSSSGVDAALAAAFDPNGKPIPKAENWIDSHGELAHQLGLTARAGVTGALGVPAMLGNGLNSAINLGIQGTNYVTGANIPQLSMPSDILQQGLSSAGLPEPKDRLERVVQGVAGGMAGTTPFMAAGKYLSKSAEPAMQELAKLLRSSPTTQVVAGGSAGGSGQGAAEVGAPGWAQALAAMVGGGAGALGTYGASKAITPIASALFPKATELIAPGTVPKANPAAAAPAVEATAGKSPTPPSPQQEATLQNTTEALLNSVPGASPTAAARQADFRSLGMKGTLGQISRDPAVFAQEQNIRGQDAGKPLLYKFNGQNQELAQALRGTAGEGSTDYQAGKLIMPKLQQFDKGLSAQVSEAYRAAEQSSGKVLDVPLTGIAQDYAKILHDFGDKVPSGVRNNFDDLGLNSGTQKKVFNIESAENILKNLNANRSADPATNLALDNLSRSVKNAILSADDQGGVFSPARALAKQRFDLHDQIPALADAVNNPLNKQGYSSTLPFEKFAQTHIINGNVDTLGALGNLLKNISPESFAELQGQIGNKLQSAAFGVNMAGDKVFRPEMFGKALTQQLGPDLLGKIYTPEQLDTLRGIGRVGTYINSDPAFAPVNHSNTGGALTHTLTQVPWIGKHIGSAAERALVAKFLRGSLEDTIGLGSQQSSSFIPTAVNAASLQQRKP